MKPNKNQYVWDDGELDRFRYFMSLPLKKKLSFLEQLNRFFDKAMPHENKMIWEKLRQKGF